MKRVAGECALQCVERLRFLPGNASGRRRVGKVDEEVAEVLPQLLARPHGPVLEPVLGQKIAGIRDRRGAQIGEIAGGSGQRRKLLELPYIDLDQPIREEHDDVVAQLQPSVARPVAREYPTGDVQRLVQVVHRGHRITVGPQRIEEHVAVQTLITRQCQQLDERARFTQTPCSGVDGLFASIHTKTTEQPYAHARPPEPAYPPGRSPPLGAARGTWRARRPGEHSGAVWSLMGPTVLRLPPSRCTARLCYIASTESRADRPQPDESGRPAAR